MKMDLTTNITSQGEQGFLDECIAHDLSFSVNEWADLGIMWAG